MKVLVTGGGGFVGRALVLELLARGYQVVSVSRGSYPELARAGCLTVQLDIADSFEKLCEAMTGCTAVFHTAAKVDMWGAFADFFRVNVVGTANVIQAARAQGIDRLIFTSSPSVVAGSAPLRGVSESVRYPARFSAHYPHTKALAEKLVLGANSQTMRTVALRPHLIFGPGDRHFVPTIISRAKAGRLVQVGNGRNLVDVCFIEDCVSAHICALEALGAANGDAAGRAYFISQGEPVLLWEWIRCVLSLAGAPPIKHKVPHAAAELLALGAEAFCSSARLFTNQQFTPLFTRFLVHEMATDHYFDISAAARELGFRPTYTVEQALKRTFQDFHNALL